MNTPFVKYVLLYTTLVPLPNSPCLNCPIILSYYIPSVGFTKARHQTSTYIWATSHIYLTLSHLSYNHSIFTLCNPTLFVCILACELPMNCTII